MFQFPFITMKRTSAFILVFVLFTAFACSSQGAEPKYEPVPLSPAALARAFAAPPANARPWCYWYWLYQNISREGIVADLDGLANAGIGGVYLMNVGGDGTLPSGDVIYGSEQWWDLFKFAVSEAAKRNIRFGFHSPGYSGVGGPWITPEYGMQELVWSEAVVEGGKALEVELPRPEVRLNYYRDVAVLAFPQLPDDEQLPTPTYQSPEGKVLTLGPGKPPMELPAEIDVVYPRVVTARSLFIAGKNLDAKLSFWDEKENTFKLVTRCRSVHTDLPVHPGSAAFEPVRASKFRLVFTESPALYEIRLGGGSRLSRWVYKTGYARKPSEPSPADTRELQGSVISRESIVNLSSKMDANGRLAWSPPAGRWTILRFGHTPTGSKIQPAPEGGKGLECDKMSEEAVDYHYDHCVRPMMQRIGNELAEKSFVNYHSDSYEGGIQTWTKEFPQRFAKLRGYDPMIYLPCLTGRMVGDEKQTEQFLWDFRCTISDLFTKAHFEQLAKRCAQDGIVFSNEPYGGPWSQLQVANAADIPMIEFWSFYSPSQRGLMIANKAGLLAGRANERPIIAAEAFTSGRDDRWSNHPFKLKALGDWAYCAGVNRFVLHMSAHQPWMEENLKPAFTCGGCGTGFSRTNTWWKHGAPEFIGGYLARCQTVLQQGVPQADAIYFQSEDSPSQYGPFEPAFPEGYDFDACSIEPLTRMKVDNGMLVLPKGKAYRYLVLPSSKRMTLASLKVIHSLAKSGAQVVGQVPEESPSLADAGKRQEFDTLRDELRKLIRSEKSFSDILRHDGIVPDFEYQSKTQILHAGHRRIGNAEVYFVANASKQAGTITCRFRVTGRRPELWYPDTGRIEPCSVYREEPGVTEIPLSFDPSGSVFVVFQQEQPGLHATQVERTGKSEAQGVSPWVLKQNGKGVSLQSQSGGDFEVTWSDGAKQKLIVPAIQTPMEIKGPWKVNFPKGLGAPEQVQLEQLISWTEHPDEGVKYFSGTAVYQCEFTVKDDLPKAVLDLGRVEVIAKATLNGEPLDVLWKPPFVYDVSGKLHKGVNHLQVEVTNLWPNRMIGDENYPDDCTPDHSWTKGALRAWPAWVKNKQARPDPRRIGFGAVKFYQKGDPLLPSGLLGPMMIVPYAEVPVSP